MTEREGLDSGVVPQGKRKGRPVVKTKRSVLACLVVCFFLVPSPALSQNEVLPGNTLGLEQCIALALERHPSLAGAQGNLKASRSRVSEAKSGYYPQLSAASAYTKDRPADTEDTKGSTESHYASSLDLSQMLLDFGRTSTQVKVQSFSAQASEGDLSNTVRQVVFNVKQSYYGVLRARQAIDNFSEEIRQLQLHLDQARKFYGVGLKPRIDVTNAEVNLGQARLELLRAQNALRIARSGLNNAMGMPDAPAFEVLDETGFQDYPADLEAALDKAYRQRPDLVAARARLDAARSSVDLARKGYYPSLSGNAGYGWSGRDYPLDDEWIVGARIDIPLFNGFLTRSRVEEARGSLEASEAGERQVRQNIRYEVELAYHTLKSAREQIVLAELTTRQARENRELATGRYREGVGSSIEVADAVLTEVQARVSYNTALYVYRIAVAGLEHAMGENR